MSGHLIQYWGVYQKFFAYWDGSIATARSENITENINTNFSYEFAGKVIYSNRLIVT